MKQTIQSQSDTIATLEKQIIPLNKGSKYIIIIPKPLIDSAVLTLDKFYKFEIKPSDKTEVIEGVSEAKKRIRSEKNGKTEMQIL